MLESRVGNVRTAAGAAAGVAFGVALATVFPLGEPARVPPPPVDDVRPSSPPLQPTFDGPDAPRAQLPGRLVPMVRDVGQPTDLAFVPGHPERLVVTSKWGTVHLIDLRRGTREKWRWLDVEDDLELGVLGIGFHPAFEANGRFWVNHVPRTDDERLATVLTELWTDPRTLSRPRKVADVLRTPQPEGTHNGGQIAFGPDGRLYLALGDGAAGGDPYRSGQDRSTRLGALLRLDVDVPGAYRVPDDNPFVDLAGAAPEIWAWGLRNPWRFTHAPDGRLVVADVGQSQWEEINLVERGDNLGWRLREGTGCFETEPCPPGDGLVDPIYGLACVGAMDRLSELLGGRAGERRVAAQLPVARQAARESIR